VPRYYLDLPQDTNPRAWDPHAGPRMERPDTRYFGRAFAEMEKGLRDPELEVYLTWSVDRLPSYGDRVVAVLLGDEVGRIPRYADRVGAVFKSYGTRPVLGSRPVDLDATELLAIAQWAYRWVRWLPGGTAHGWRLARRRVRRERIPSRLFTIPLGTYNQLDLPMLSIESRPTDLFFAGSIEHYGSSRRLRSPKQRAREEMLAAVERLGRTRSGLQLDIRRTPGFTASANASPAAYSQALMSSRVCLAPRGTSLETFRVFEGLRYGCIVVTERLPSRWFYDGAPLLQLDCWADLEQVIARVLDDPAELQSWHLRALAWWQERCSEIAVGRYLAACLNALSPAGDTGSDPEPHRPRNRESASAPPDQ
jgi:hypothetical protein